MIVITLLSIAVFAGDAFLTKDAKPSDKLDKATTDKLVVKNAYVWNTTHYWKANNCYYFDLYIGNETNVTWSDTQRELKCTKDNLNASDIEKLQLLNVEWTLKQLSIDAVVVAPTVTKSEKGENLKAVAK